MRSLPAIALVALSLGMASAAAAQPAAPDPDLIKLGQSVLPSDDPAPVARPTGGRPGKRPAAVADAGAKPLANGPTDAAADATTDAATDAAEAPDASPLEAGGADRPEAVPAAIDAGPAPDATAKSKALDAPAAAAPVGLGRAARKARIDSGQNLPMTAAAESPLAKIGVPVEAVPAIATAATVGAMAFWPFLLKTLTGLLKAVFGSFLKTRAKKGQKIDTTQRALNMGGFIVRPAELAALLVGALIYGLGVCYAFQGKRMSGSFLVGQEALVVLIYYSRSFVRWAYERAFKLKTQYKFWPGGGVLCLASAYLGNTLGTVGYEVEEATTPEDNARIVKMKAWLIAISLGLALVFFALNVLYPAKIWQSGRLMMSGMALAEILPITPMPGMKIYKWKPSIWVLLVVLVVPSFILINFVL
jgi:hypothetical protein